MKENSSDFNTILLEWMVIFARRSIHDFLKFAHEHGLNMTQISILLRLYYRGPATIADLRQDLFGSRAAASQMFDHLVQGGWVERVEAVTDRRLKVVTLTDTGRLLVENGVAARRKWLEEMAKHFSPEERQQIEKVLQTMIQAALASETTEESSSEPR